MTGNVVHVTQQDIEAGDPEYAESCPIALAMSAWHQYQWRVEFEWADAADGRGLHWVLEPDVTNWLCRFDGGYSVDPIALFMDTELLTIRLLSYEECGL